MQVWRLDFVELLLICLVSVVDVHPAFIGRTKGCDYVCQQECMGVHNMYRANHDAPPLAYDQRLADQAQSLIDRGAFKHSDWASKTGGGETFAWGSLFPTFTAAIKSWHDEGVGFNYKTGKAINESKTVRHFAQVVWKDSRRVGCGRGQLDGQPWYVVCYDRGAVMKNDAVRQNVKPPKDNDRTWFQKSSPYANELRVVAQI